MQMQLGTYLIIYLCWCTCTQLTEGSGCSLGNFHSCKESVCTQLVSVMALGSNEDFILLSIYRHQS